MAILPRTTVPEQTPWESRRSVGVYPLVEGLTINRRALPWLTTERADLNPNFAEDVRRRFLAEWDAQLVITERRAASLEMYGEYVRADRLRKNATAYLRQVLAVDDAAWWDARAGLDPLTDNFLLEPMAGKAVAR